MNSVIEESIFLNVSGNKVSINIIQSQISSLVNLHEICYLSALVSKYCGFLQQIWMKYIFYDI